MRTEEPESERLQKIREELPAVTAAAYFNAGTCGPLPRRSFLAMQEVAERELALGRIAPGRFPEEGARRDRLRGRIARLFGADSREIALTDRTSDGLNIALWGIDWRPGDEVITTRHEHPGLLAPLAAIARRRGVAVRHLDLPESSEDLPKALAGAVRPRTRAIALSHVLWTNGAVLPIAEIAAFARARDILTIVDGAQGAGAVALDLRRAGVDFYALPGQKWLLGPEGTGALYVAQDALSACLPTFSGYLSVQGLDEDAPYALPAPGARRYEIGMSAPALTAGLLASLDFIAEVGLEFIVRRTALLARELRQELLGVCGLQVLTPGAGPASGLVSLRLPGGGEDKAALQLAREGVQLRSIPAPHGCLRVSTGFYNTRAELGELVRRIDRLARG